MQSLEPEVRSAINSAYAELGRTGTVGPVSWSPATNITDFDAEQGVGHQPSSSTMDPKKGMKEDEKSGSSASREAPALCGQTIWEGQAKRLKIIGGPHRDRTDDHFHAMEVHYGIC